MADRSASAGTPLIDLFRLNTLLFRNALAGIDEAGGTTRPNERVNSAAFIGGHLVETRAWMGRYLGLDTPPPFGGALEHATGIDTLATLPSLEAIRAEWDRVSAVVLERIGGLTDVELAGPSSQRFPGVPPTAHGGLGFLLQHESYHVGQLGYLRKYLGLPAMSYR